MMYSRTRNARPYSRGAHCASVFCIDISSPFGFNKSIYIFGGGVWTIV